MRVRELGVRCVPSGKVSCRVWPVGTFISCITLVGTCLCAVGCGVVTNCFCVMFSASHMLHVIKVTATAAAMRHRLRFWRILSACIFSYIRAVSRSLEQFTGSAREIKSCSFKSSSEPSNRMSYISLFMGDNVLFVF